MMASRHGGTDWNTILADVDVMILNLFGFEGKKRTFYIGS